MTLRGNFSDYHARRRNRAQAESSSPAAVKATKGEQAPVSQAPADTPEMIKGVFFQQCGGGRRIIRKKIGGV